MKNNKFWWNFRLFSVCFAFFAVALAAIFFFDAKKYEISHAGQVSQNTSNFTNLVVFVRFNGEDEFIDKDCGNGQTVKKITENNYSLAEYNVKDYFYRVSNGKVKMQTLYLFDADGGSIELTNTREYYTQKSSTTPSGYDNTNKALRMLELKQDWTRAIGSAFSGGGKITDVEGVADYSVAELDKNADGLIDCLTIIYGYSDEYFVESADVLWDYQDYYDALEISQGETSVKSGNYLQITANYGELFKDTSNIYFSNFKVSVHEMGHIFGLKDLYKKDMTSPVYYMSAMAKAIDPVPQFISAKEREALGWLNSSNVQTIGEAGNYTITPTKGLEDNNVVCYKLKIPSIDKILYLEYRKFDGTDNKYDTQSKSFSKANGDVFVSSVNLKTGLVCYLIDKYAKYPNNYSNVNCNYEVVGGGTTKNDSALALGEDVDIGGLNIEVTAIGNTGLTFSVVGTDMEHLHTIAHVPRKSASCVETGNDEYWKCETCGKYYDDEALSYEKTLSELTIAKKPHNKLWFGEVSATCTEEGLTAGEKCTACGEVFSGFHVISKTSHSSSGWIIDKDSTATELGEKHKECLVCGEVLETGVIELKATQVGEGNEENVAGKDDNHGGGGNDEQSDEPEQTRNEQKENKPNTNIKIWIISLSAVATCLLGCAVVVVVKKEKRKLE